LQVLQHRRLRLHLPDQGLDLLTHLGKKRHNRLFPLEEGAMDLVTGRESQVHGRRINSRTAAGNRRIAAGWTYPSIDLTGDFFQINSPSMLLGWDTLVVTHFFNQAVDNKLIQAYKNNTIKLLKFVFKK
jgi:hypothetical protein